MEIPETAQSKSTSPWMYIAIGCGAAILVAVVVVAGVTFMGYRAIKRVAEDMKNPVAREAKVKQILGCQTLPDGYKAGFTLSVPWIMDLAILSDRDVDLRGRHEKLFDKRGFVYVKSIKTHGAKRAKDYFEGNADPREFLGHGDIDISRGKEVARGSFQSKEMMIYYIAMEGDLRVKGERMDGITTLMYMECPNDNRFRLGIWFGPKPGDEGQAVASADEPELAPFGTVSAQPQLLRVAAASAEPGFASIAASAEWHSGSGTVSVESGSDTRTVSARTSAQPRSRSGTVSTEPAGTDSTEPYSGARTASTEPYSGAGTVSTEPYSGAGTLSATASAGSHSTSMTLPVIFPTTFPVTASSTLLVNASATFPVADSQPDGAQNGPTPPKTAPPEYAGTAADEAAIKEFMSHFSPCGS